MLERCLPPLTGLCIPSSLITKAHLGSLLIFPSLSDYRPETVCVMTHAMVITAVHLDTEGNPVRFKVQDSWSDTAGDHGYFMMTNAWFDEFVYQIFIPKLVVPSD
ncbi:hypothetical protein PGT21_002227 [Puccinia graminis f. sp. tritici]|uniref:Uncharacterized protein n=1 Tax=Puccinia graminis f. sp. tritici TaxID=56615 RepID=A0A5B0Q4M4_PUCGR|nr:hypothetical protein PGT21_002227 [Puccinia graminis f. sp. tritici]